MKHANPLKKDVDVFIQTESRGGIPSRVPSLAIFYDVIPLLFKHDIAAPDLKGLAKFKHRLGQKQSNKRFTETLTDYKKAKSVVAISKHSMLDYKKFIDSNPTNRVSYTHCGLIDNPDGSQKIEDERVYLQKTYEIPKDKRFMLYVGAIDLRKNIKQLLIELKDLIKDNPDIILVAAGKEFTLKKNLALVGWPQILKEFPELNKHLVTPGYVKNEDLPILYKNAELYLFPSRYEGFGLTALEAFKYKCPFVAYDNSSTSEVVGKDGLLVKDGESMHETITKVLEDPKTRQKLIQNGNERLKLFNWEDNANHIYNELKIIASK